MEWLALIVAALKGLGSIQSFVADFKALNLASRLASIEEKNQQMQAGFLAMASAETPEDKKAALNAIASSWSGN